MYIYRARIFAFENLSWGVSQNSLSTTLQPRPPFRRQLLFVAATLVAAVALASGCSGYMPSKAGTVANRNDSASTAILAATPSYASFGAVAVGTQNTQTIQVSNPGSQSVFIYSAAVVGNGFTVSGLSTPLPLAAGATTSFTVKFLPAASGNVTGSVTLQGSTYQVFGQPNAGHGVALLSIPVSGAGGTATRTLQLSSSALNFGNETIGGSSTLGVNLVNAGNSSVTVSQASASGSGFSVLSGVSGATIAPGHTAILQIEFAPKTAGSFAGTVTVTSNSSNSPLSLRLSGSGVGGGSSRTVALSWNPSNSENVMGYNIYRSTTADGSYSRINFSPTNATKYADGSVTAGATYYYVVTAVISSGLESAHSNQTRALIP
jgi:hypothetical protein